MSEFAPKRSRKPFAILAAGLALTSLAGCGGDKKTFEFEILCKNSHDKLIVSDPEESNGSQDNIYRVGVTCKNRNGKHGVPIEVYPLEGDSAIGYSYRSNFILRATIDQTGTFIEPDKGTVAYQHKPNSEIQKSSSIFFVNAESVQNVAISTVPVSIYSIK